MRVCLTGVMVVSIATANVAPVFAAEPVEKVETESDSWDSISGEINFRDTDNNESIFVQFNNEKWRIIVGVMIRKIHMKYCRQKL